MITLYPIYSFLAPFISAASGLAFKDGWFSIVSDDELTLISIHASLNGRGQSLPLFTGSLPLDEKERKKQKPDFESLVVINPETLLCLPSGSTENRMRAVLVSNNQVQEVSLKNVYTELLGHFSELNIEGATLIGPNIRLFQRGNGKLHQNGLIDLNLESFLKDQIQDLKIKNINLGQLKNVPLSFTDACFEKGICWFLAVAESSESTYDDGEFVGAVLGKMDLEGNILSTEELSVPYKPEGLFIQDQMLYVVTDADNREIPSALYSAKLPQGLS